MRSGRRRPAVAYALGAAVLLACATPLLAQRQVTRAGAGLGRIEQIKTALSRILSRPEFGAQHPAGNPLTGAAAAIRQQWNRFWRWVERLFERIPGAIGRGGGMVLLYAFIALFLVGGALLLGSLVRARTASGKGVAAPRPAPVFEVDAPDEPLDPEAWLRRGAALATEGEYRRAFRAVFIASLLFLSSHGVLEYHRSRSNGDYLRSLANRSDRETYRTLAGFAAEFDDRWYGHRPTAESDYRAALARCGRLRAAADPGGAS